MILLIILKHFPVILNELLNDQTISQIEYDQATKETIKCIGNNPNDDDINALYHSSHGPR